MFQSKRIKVGDKVPVALNGKISELEVIRVFRSSMREKILNFIALPAYKYLRKILHSQRVLVRTPEGETIECRLLRPAI